NDGGEHGVDPLIDHFNGKPPTLLLLAILAARITAVQSCILRDASELRTMAWYLASPNLRTAPRAVRDHQRIAPVPLLLELPDGRLGHLDPVRCPLTTDPEADREAPA